MPRIEYIVTTYGLPDRPWVVTATARDSVEIEDAADFAAWARETSPPRHHAVRVVAGM